MSYSYILRFGLEPGFHVEERLESLVSFCKVAKIDDVMFFVNQEEINQGHLTFEETEPWLDLIAKGKEMLAPIGVTTSINPWITLLHTDRGRTLRQGQNFTLMVDPTGRRATAVACPICPEFQKYIVEMYARYAAVNPHMLWVEDDFRLHNHAPLTWGGCFCDLHMAEFSRRAGRTLTREEFVKGLLQPGKPHPFRKIWLDVAREQMVELASSIGSAVHAVSPSTIVGLMSSVPATHCAEGRDWAGVLGGLAGPNVPMADRPHLPSYYDVTSQQYLKYFNYFSRLTQAVVPESTRIYPELENFPFSRFSKSYSFARFQIESSLALSPSGITLNIHGMMGNGVTPADSYASMLSGVKPFMEEVSKLGLPVKRQTGVKVLVDTKSSYTLHTSDGNGMAELYPAETFWSGYLSAFGIANTYSVDEIPSGEVVAISGQYLRNLDREVIEKLFEENYVLLTGEAASTLFEIGCGDLAGIKRAVRREMDSGYQAYEQICNGRVYCGLKEARVTAQVNTGDFLEIEYADQPSLITVAKSPAGETVSPGMAVYGDKVFILPYFPSSAGSDALLTPVRQEVIQQWLVESLGSRSPFFAVGDPFISVYSYDLGDKVALLLTNASGDDYGEVRLHAPGCSVEGATELSAKTGMAQAEIEHRDGELVLTPGLTRLQVKVLLLRREGVE
jgi:hypothetical protein